MQELARQGNHLSLLRRGVSAETDRQPNPDTVKREKPIRISDVMGLTGYSRSYIYMLVHWGKIPCYHPTHGRLFFYESEILDFLTRNRQAADYEISKRADAILNGEAKGGGTA
jgi:predicted DNA-binding transcriptional regulator AlpA